MAIKITITNAGSGISSLLDIYSGDGITYSMYISNVSKTDLMNGYTFTAAMGATKYKVADKSCGSFVEFSCAAITTTTTTSGPTTTTTSGPTTTTTSGPTTTTTSGPTTTTTSGPTTTTTTTTYVGPSTTTTTIVETTTSTTSTTTLPLTTSTTTCATIYEYLYNATSRATKELACADTAITTLWAYDYLDLGVTLYYTKTGCILSNPASGLLGQYKKLTYDGYDYAIEINSSGVIISATLCSSITTTTTTIIISTTTTTTTSITLWHVVNVQNSMNSNILCAYSGGEVIDIYSQTFNDNLYSGHIFYKLNGTLYTGSGYFANPQGPTSIYGTISSGVFTSIGTCAGTSTTTSTTSPSTTTTSTSTSTSTTTLIPACTTVSLKFGSNSTSACATTTYINYSVDNIDWKLANRIYNGSSCVAYATPGYYSSGTSYRYWTGSSFVGALAYCSATTSSTSTSTTTILSGTTTTTTTVAPITTTTTTIWYTKIHQCGMPESNAYNFNTTNIPHFSGINIWTDGIYYYTWLLQSTTSYYVPGVILNKSVSSTIYSSCPVSPPTTSTTTTTICQTISLGYNLSDGYSACIASFNTFRINKVSFLDATALFSTNCTTPATAGYYSDGSIYRYWTGGAFSGPSTIC